MGTRSQPGHRIDQYVERGGIVVKVIGSVVIGILMWGLSWFWPHVNDFLTPPIVIGIIAGLGAMASAYVLIQRLDHDHSDDGTSQDHPSRPMPVRAIR